MTVLAGICRPTMQRQQTERLTCVSCTFTSGGGGGGRCICPVVRLWKLRHGAVEQLCPRSHGGGVRAGIWPQGVLEEWTDGEGQGASPPWLQVSGEPGWPSEPRSPRLKWRRLVQGPTAGCEEPVPGHTGPQAGRASRGC